MSERTFDVAIIGGGPAGMAAAIAAREAKGLVALIDEGLAPGGQIWRDKLGVHSSGQAARWKTRLMSSGAGLFASTSVVDVRRHDDGFSILAERQGERLTLETRAIVLATGARERFLPFPGWTLPNVVGVGGAQALLKSGMNVHGKRVVIAGSGPLLLPVAASLAGAGADLALVAEQASLSSLVSYSMSLWRTPAMIAQAVRLRSSFARTRYASGTWVTRAEGEGCVRSVTVTNGRKTREIQCDLLCVAFGLVGNTELARLLGCQTRGGTVIVDDEQATSISGVFCAGEPTGIGGVDLSLVEGTIAGAVAMGGDVHPTLRRRRQRMRSYGARLDAAFALRPDVSSLATPDTIVCRCEDVRMADLDGTWTSRQAKLYTRAGMGACQGRICGAALECVMGWRPDSVRPPIQPARLSTMLDAGRASSSPLGAT
jgi:thioredoxin reductase